MNPSESGETDLHVQHIACANNAAFVMSFAIEREGGGRAGASGRFAIHQTRSIDLAQLRFGDEPLHVGDRVSARVSAVAGRTRNGPSIAFAPNGHTATFSVRGTTLSFTIRRV
ncbi:hypothetical protein A7A76_10145 [Lysobacter enzymogenes]|uniref:hypothetical protein n=1 Tax=Lysobacter enzymogenes TaxID=69 RepID=UPI0019D202A5|nr:hypothetical protein [Lysobacter enzymogenes]MBN7135121.1 hypothetical protein [Lysobacter enzymogenes]